MESAVLNSQDKDNDTLLYKSESESQTDMETDHYLNDIHYLHNDKEVIKDDTSTPHSQSGNSTSINTSDSVCTSSSNSILDIKNNISSLDCLNMIKFESLENSSISNVKVYSEENILNDNLSNNKSEDVVQRRNSLPENYYKGSLSSDMYVKEKCDPDSISVTDFKIDDDEHKNAYSSNKLQHSDTKNLSNVVKNVHGLFSYVKKAYKPMEKNFSGMMQATQRNLAMAKYDYLKNDKNTMKAVENISKYSTLKLSNGDESLDDALFKKCDKLNSRENLKASKTSDIQPVNVLDELKSIGDICLKIDTGNVDNDSDIYLDVTQCEDVENHEDKMDLDQSSQTPTENKYSGDELEKINGLENTISQLYQEIDSFKIALLDKDTIKKGLEAKLALTTKQLANVTAERDSIVMKYAISERNALEAIKIKEKALSTEQATKHEISMVTQRLRTANGERTRASASLDMKCHELSSAHKEISKLKEELQALDVKLKWSQSKLVSEMDAHKESNALVENLSLQIKHMEGGSNSSFPATPTHHNTDLENILREKEANIILEKHEKERYESRCKQLLAEVDQLKNLLNTSSKEVKELRAQVESGTAESAALRRACSELRDQGAKDCERLAAAQARAARCDTLAAHLQQEQDRFSKLSQELEGIKVLREEALAENELRARREAELLRQAERLTVAGVKLQATCSEAEAKALALTVDNKSLREAATRAAAEAAEARAEANREKDGRAADARALASRAAQHARGERDALSSLEAARGDLRVLSTKHASSMKELKREFQQTRRKCERYEMERKLQMHNSMTANSEKTGSTSSLSSYEGQPQSNQSPEIPHSQDVQLPSKTPENQQLIERIVSLQRMAAKRTEKIEFFEEHNRQLTQELQRKTRLLRALLVNAPSGGLSSAASDASKAEISRHGGVMASVYGSQIADETMTLELSLEINAKLQSLLEDTLLSNITLKENMDTLGDEIARLKETRKS